MSKYIEKIKEMQINELQDFERKVYMSDMHYKEKEPLVKAIDNRKKELNHENIMVEASEICEGDLR